jgi:hypothetical protein
MNWVESGQAWGERAADWAYLMEPYARRANDALFDRTAVVRAPGCWTSPAVRDTRPELPPGAARRSLGWTPPRR